MSLPSSTRPLRHGLNLSRFDDGMHPSACYDWLCTELNRPPEPYDLYHTGKMLYQNGRYKGASKMLQLYVDGNGNELPGHHLLGYAYAFLEEKRQAIQQLKKVANSQNRKKTAHTQTYACACSTYTCDDSLLGLCDSASLSVVCLCCPRRFRCGLAAADRVTGRCRSRGRTTTATAATYQSRDKRWGDVNTDPTSDPPTPTMTNRKTPAQHPTDHE